MPAFPSSRPVRDALVRALAALALVFTIGCAGGSSGFDDGGDAGPDAMATGCVAPQIACGAVCTDTNTDPAHCGGCATACPTGAACRLGACVSAGCASGETDCNGSCVDVRTDPDHCGSCTLACSEGMACVDGHCGTSTNGAGRTSGAACARDTDCGGVGGRCLLPAQGYTDGYCTYAACTASSCGTGGRCVRVTASATQCFRDCTPGAAGGCRPGYVCTALESPAGAGVCVPACEVDPALLCGQYACNRTTHECELSCSSIAMCSAGSTCEGGGCACSRTTACGAGRSCDLNSGQCL